MVVNMNLMSNEELRNLQGKLINLSLNEVNLDIERCENEGDFEGVAIFLSVKESIDTILDYIDKQCR